MNMGGRTLVVVLATLAVFAIGCMWLFNSAMNDKEGRIKVNRAMFRAREVQNAIAAYHAERKVLPLDNSALRLSGKESMPYLTASEQQGDLSFEILVETGTLTVTFASEQALIGGRTLIFVPRPAREGLEWSCNRGTVDVRYRPQQCRGE